MLPAVIEEEDEDKEVENIVNQLEEVKVEEEEDDEKDGIDVLEKAKEYQRGQKAVEEVKGEELIDTKLVRSNNSTSANLYQAICHSFFIAKDNVEINWRKPYV